MLPRIGSILAPPLVAILDRENGSALRLGGRPFDRSDPVHERKDDGVKLDLGAALEPRDGHGVPRRAFR